MNEILRKRILWCEGLSCLLCALSRNVLPRLQLGEDAYISQEIFEVHFKGV